MDIDEDNSSLYIQMFSVHGLLRSQNMQLGFETEVPELYRMAAEHHGVFVNPALNEPFGITLLEASASGLPIVATKNGGPKEIIEKCKSGLMVDPTNSTQIAGAVKKIIIHKDRWRTFFKNGIFNTHELYTWKAHAKTYVALLKKKFGHTQVASRIFNHLEKTMIATNSASRSVVPPL